MTIQQVSGGNGNSIVNFLFQDDGGGEGTVLDGADFSKTLHQLLGEFDDDDSSLAGGDAAMTQETPLTDDVADTPASTVAPEEAATPALSAELDALTSDFTLPLHGAELPDPAQWQDDAEGQDLTAPFWHSAAFSDTAQPGVVPLDITQIRDPAAAQADLMPDTTAYDTPAANDPNFSATPFNKGIDHVVALARQSEQASVELAQQNAAPAAMPSSRDGRTKSASGKFLPLTFRQPGLNQAVAGTQGKAQMNQAAPIGMPTAADNVAPPSSDIANLFGETLAAESRTQQPASQQASAVMQGIHGLRNDAALMNPSKTFATEATTAAALMHSSYVAGTDAWLQDLGTRVEWLKDQDMSSAELQLHPAELGSLEIHISTVDDATTVSFVTHNAAAREIIEDSLPRLREMFASQGMQLGESHVSQQSAEDQQRGQDLGHKGARGNDGDTTEPAPQRRSVYMADPNRIDHYV